MPQKDDMTDLGTKLKQERLNRDYPIEYVCEHTKISKRFLIAIEENDLSLFPAELYLEGFIINLCELYEIDPQPFLEERSLYLEKQQQEKKIIEEEHEPVKESPEKNSFIQVLKQPNLTVAAVIVALLLVLILFILLFFKEKEKITLIMPNNETTDASIYKLTEEKETFDLKAHDSVNIFLNNEYRKFVLKAVHEDFVRFNVNGMDYSIGETNPMSIDLNNDESTDLEIDLKEIAGELAIIFFRLINYKNQSVDFQHIWNTQGQILVGKQYTLFKNQKKVPIELYVKAESLPSHLSYHIDGRRQNSIKLNTGSDRIIVAEEHIIIDIGNYRSIMFIINKIPINLSLDHDKYSVTKIIKWVANSNNETKFDLIIKNSLN